MSETCPGALEEHVRPPLAIPGNKASIADEIIRRIPEHETYVEVFGGTAGVLFNKRASRNEVINDADGAVHTFLTVLRDDVGELQEWLEAQPYSERDYEEWRQRWHDGWRPRDDVVCAGVYFFLRRASFGADMGGFRATADGRRFAPRQFRNAIERLPALAERLQDVLLLNQDFEAVLRRYATSDDVFLYLDPPYKGSLHRYKASLFDRGRFCGVLAELEGGDLVDSSGDRVDWLVSAASVPAPLEPYPVVELDCTHHIDNQGGGTDVQEKLVMNYEMDAREQFCGVDQASISEF